MSVSYLTAKPVETAGACGGTGAGDRRTALQTWLWQVRDGGMLSQVLPWARLHTLPEVLNCVTEHKLHSHSVGCLCVCFSLQDRVCELKEEVRLQYQRMHQLLEEDLGRALEALDRAQSRFCQENTAQILALGEQRHEAQKLLSSIHTAFSKAEELSFMKNTKPVKILTDRWENGCSTWILKMSRFACGSELCSLCFQADVFILNFACLLALVAGLRHAWAAPSLLTKLGI